MRTHRLQPDTVFAGRYRVLRLLGRGAMGSVYLVDDTETRAAYALKVMSPDLLGDAGFVARFVQEARIGRTIASAHVVQVVASGIDEAHGLPWFAMEYLAGQDLGRWLEARPPLSRGAAAGAQLFGALAAAHDAAVVHRDLRPENVFVMAGTNPPFLKVLDFGVAKVVREASMGATAPGLGTPLWAAPEQAAPGGVRPSADVWPLGLLAFRLLGGKVFWKSASDASASAFDLAVELLRAPIPPASARAAELGVADRLPASFDAWFARAVVRDRAARFATARDAWEALAPLLAGR